MDSLRLNESGNHSNNLLIDWSTPEIIKIKIHNDNLVNNPFDVLELKAANMDPFDLVPNYSLFREEPPCANILNSEIDSFSLFKDDIVDNESKNNHVTVDIDDEKSKNIHVAVDIDDDKSKNNLVTVNIVDNQSKNDHVTIDTNEGNVDLSKTYCKVEEEIEKNEQKIDSSSDNYEIENMPLCDEDEKERIREETRQHIEMIIEKGRKLEEPLCYTPMKKRDSPKSFLNKTKTFFDNGFILNDSDENLESRNLNSLSKTPDVLIDIHTSSSSPRFHFEELNSFDLNSLKPEWIMDNICESENFNNVSNKEESSSKVEDTCTNNQVDDRLKTLNGIEVIESKLNGCQTVLKSMKNERVKVKGPCIANVPIQQMVKDYKVEDIKDKNKSSNNHFKRLKPVASSTPTSDTSDLSPNSHNSSVLSGNLSRRSLPNSNASPSTPLNVTRNIKTKTPNLLLKKIKYEIENKKTPSNAALCLINSTNSNRRSNSSVNLYSGDNYGRNTEIMKSFQSKKSKSESKIDKIPKLSTLFTKTTSGLPVPKRIYLNGKENIKPHI